MQAASIERLHELQQIISRLPMERCWMWALPEFGVGWRDVSRAVRNSRLPMVPSSVARVLVRHVAKSLPDEELAQIVARLRLKLIATQERKWHVIDLLEPIQEDISIAHLIAAVPSRVAQALKKSRGRRIVMPEVQTALLDDLLYMSAQLVSESKAGAALYLVTPPGQSVALVSAVNSSLLKACVEGLGYRKHEDAQLFGRDICSLLRIHARNNNENVLHLAAPPEYNPVPMLTANGIDYTYKDYNEKYVEEILGPDPPLLTELKITTSKPFFDPQRLNKNIKLTVHLKSDDLAKTLKSHVAKGALSPTSDFFQIFNKVKSNKITFQNDDEMQE